MNGVQTSFLDGTYSLIHIPLELYSTFLQPILKVVLPQTPRSDGSPAIADDDDRPQEGNYLTRDHQHIFLNVSITPIECSIVCHTVWTEHIFTPAITKLPPDVAAAVSVSEDTYLIVSVDSAGGDPAGRVTELSAPLAIAGIPIFFIATYFSDFVLVPTRERHNVIRALVDGGFGFTENGEDTPATSPVVKKGMAMIPSPPRTPTASLNEMQARIFDMLKREEVHPRIPPDLELVQCAGKQLNSIRPEFSSRQSVRGRQPNWADNVDPKLYVAMVSALTSQPEFLSVTMAQDDPPALLMDKRLCDVFGDSVVGDNTAANVYVPLLLDLNRLSHEATGIVCGVARRLVEETQFTDSSQLSYLSTARAGAVIMSSDQAHRALEVLEEMLERDGPEG
jgi:hypothetical protein